MKTVTKTDFVSEMASKLGESKAQVARFIDVFFDEISSNLKKGNKVAFTGYASFSKTMRKARTGHNPRTGEKIKIAAKEVVKIKAGKKLI